MKLEPSLETLQARIELRVLFGPQAGSRLQVAPGNYDLGEGDECEVILSGPKMLGRHAQLSFDGEQLTISPLDGKVCDAQGNEISESFPLGSAERVIISERIWLRATLSLVAVTTVLPSTSSSST